MLPSPPTLNLLVAGCQRTGKTALLRLLLDTCDVALAASPQQIASVAKFVHEAGRPTTSFRSASIQINGPAPTSEPFTLGIIDSPGLDFEDESELENGLNAIIRTIEARFVESATTNRQDSHDQHIHLCIYLLDPDDIIPEITRQAPRTGAFRPKTGEPATSDVSDFESEDDGNGNSSRLKQRPSIPIAEISAMKRLSARVNLLPVVARTDALTEARLKAIKRAVKRDLQEAGLTFGVFDPPREKEKDRASEQTSYASVPTDGSPVPASAVPSVLPPTPISPRHSGPQSVPESISHASLRSATEIASLLPFSLISPEHYSYGDGVVRRYAKKATRQEIAAQYSPNKEKDAIKDERDFANRFTRRYKWGSINVLDHTHCDFLALRTAVLAIHREALRAKTGEYFSQYMQDQSQIQQTLRAVEEGRRQNTEATTPIWQNPSQQQYQIQHQPHVPGQQPVQSHSQPLAHTNGDGRYLAGSSDAGGRVGQFQTAPLDMYARVIPLAVSRGPRAKTKKILVACNFCRSRKLKCDGGRPQCAQCQRRHLDCSYEDTLKRRGVGRLPRDDESLNGEEEDQSGTPARSTSVAGSTSAGTVRRTEGRARADSRSGEGESSSPVATRKVSPATSRTMSPVTRKGSPVAPHPVADQSSAHLGYIPPRPLLIQAASVSTPPAGPSSDRHPATSQQRVLKQSQQHASGTTMLVMTMPFPGSLGGSKATACSFCKTRKTKCDGNRPACSNCRKKQVDCFYPEDGRARQQQQLAADREDGAGKNTISRSGSGSASGSTSTPTSQDQQQRERERNQAAIDHAHAQAMHQHTFHQQPFQHHTISGSRQRAQHGQEHQQQHYYHHKPHHGPHSHPPMHHRSSHNHASHNSHQNRRSPSLDLHSPPRHHPSPRHHTPPPSHIPILPPIQPPHESSPSTLKKIAPSSGAYHHHPPPHHRQNQLSISHPQQLPLSSSSLHLPALRTPSAAGAVAQYPTPPVAYHQYHHYHRPETGSPPRPSSSAGHPLDRPGSRIGRPLSRHGRPDSRMDRPLSTPGRSASRDVESKRGDELGRNGDHGSFTKRKSMDESLSPAMKRARVDDHEGRHDLPGGEGVNGYHHRYMDRYDASGSRPVGGDDRFGARRVSPSVKSEGGDTGRREKISSRANDDGRPSTGGRPPDGRLVEGRYLPPPVGLPLPPPAPQHGNWYDR